MLSMLIFSCWKFREAVENVVAGQNGDFKPLYTVFGRDLQEGRAATFGVHAAGISYNHDFPGNKRRQNAVN